MDQKHVHLNIKFNIKADNDTDQMIMKTKK